MSLTCENAAHVITVYEHEPDGYRVLWNEQTGAVRVAPDGEWLQPRMEGLYKSAFDGRAQMRQGLRQWRDRAKALESAIEPFARLLQGTSGRIPVERLSASDWHELIKAYKGRAPFDPDALDAE